MSAQQSFCYLIRPFVIPFTSLVYRLSSIQTKVSEEPTGEEKKVTKKKSPEKKSRSRKISHQEKKVSSNDEERKSHVLFYPGRKSHREKVTMKRVTG